ncbi:MAG: hypothetical protein Q9217_000612 [Psora testacea]
MDRRIAANGVPVDAFGRPDPDPDQSAKPRPISFGGVFSGTLDLVPRSISPARSMSTRLSNISTPPNRSEQPSRATSTNPRVGRKPVPNFTQDEREMSPSPSRILLNPCLRNQNQAQNHGNDSNVNHRFSKFSFVPSYATSWVGDTSEAGEEQNDESYSEDGQNSSRFGSVSTSSEYPPGTSQKVKSPPPGNKHHARDGEEGANSNGIGLPSGVQSTVLGFGDETHIEDGIMVAGESERGSRLSLPLARKVPGSSELREGNRGGTPEIVVDSPKLPKFAHVKNEPKSPRASKTLHVPFLHKFRKRDTEKKGLAGPSISTEQPNKVSPDHQQLNSFFDPTSGDGEENHEYGGAFLGNARQVSFRRPGFVPKTSSPQLGLVDVLNRGPSIRSQNISPLSGAERRTVSPANLEPQEKRESRRSGVIGWPMAESENTKRPQDTGNHERGDERVSGLWTGVCDPFASAPRPPADGLHSHPVSVKKPFKGQVTFPPSPNLDVRLEQRFAGEDVLSTPYPLGYNADGGKGDGTEQDEEGKKAYLTLVVYGYGNHVPKVKRLSIPTAVHEIPISDKSNEGHPQAKAIMRKDFDDASLSSLIHSTYHQLRGARFANFSARTVCGIRLLSYQSACQLATKRARHTCFEGRGEDDGFAEAQLLELYKHPKIGKGRWEWFAWVRGLPGYGAVEDVDGPPREKVALELIEGFSARRILLALSIVAVCSLVATLLWIFVGVNRITSGIPLNPSGLGAGKPTTTPTSIRYTTSGDVVEITGFQTAIPATTFATEDPAIASFSSAILASATGGWSGNFEIATMKARDHTLTSSADGASSTSLISELAQSDRFGEYMLGGAGSRVGAGVALGVLVLLLGWMGVVGWVALSWMVG